MSTYRLVLLCSFCWITAALAACVPAAPARLPTSLPAEFLPTAIALTVQAEQSPTALLTPLAPTPKSSLPPTASPTPRHTLPPAKPTFTPTAAATVVFSETPEPSPSPSATLRATSLPTLTPIPDAAIQFLDPGPGSRLISPLRLNAYLKPGLDGRVQIELLGEDGRVLVRKVFSYIPEVRRTFLTEMLEFEIRSVAEAARLQISTFDTYQRLLAFNSVDLLLLSFGENDLNPPGSLSERILIEEPLPNKLIQGGSLIVSGLAHPSSDQPLLVELTTADGKVVGYRQAGVILDPNGGYVPFRVEVPYQVDEPTWVRLSITEASAGRIEGVLYLTSLEVLLSP